MVNEMNGGKEEGFFRILKHKQRVLLQPILGYDRRF